MPRKKTMPEKITKQELLESEYKELFTRDPEIFFEAMLISLRSNTMQPLEGKRMNFQKVIFKNWFRVYDRELRKRLVDDIPALREAREQGRSAGLLLAFKSIPMKRGLFGHKLDKKALKVLIRDLEAEL